MRSAILRGREHHAYGWIEAVGEGPTAAALSIGGAPKPYAHTDPNEDAAGIGWGSCGSMIVVADAHDGFEASEVLIEHLLGTTAPHWVDGPEAPDADQWQRHAIAALCDANAEILRERTARAGFASTSTLTLAVARPDEGHLLHAAMGDSHLFLVGPAGAREIAPVVHKSRFLGQEPVTSDALAPIVRVGLEPLGDAWAVVAVTDGLSERGIGVEDPAAAVHAAARKTALADPPLRALTLARAVAEAALDAQQKQDAGDNVGVAACWLAEDPARSGAGA